ncbi:MAG: RNA polymerase sigma factor [Fimbriimonadaceae bacterium]|nr:RNA polymerase sigma factor [Fimbriimonadaceae bacterium]
MFWKSRTTDFEKAVRPELPVLFRVCRRLGASADDAEDFVQLTMLRAYEHWDRFDGRFLRSWLIRILRNEVIRSRRGPPPPVSLEVLSDQDVVEEPFWSEVLWRDQAHRLLEEVDKLPDIHRMLIQLCDIEELTYEEAADALDIPIGTVRSRLFRARSRLRERLSPTQMGFAEVDA